MKTSPLYEFALPRWTNADAQGTRLSYDLERRTWEGIACRLVGGFTRSVPAFGTWWADDGTVYADEMIGYRVACDPERMSALLDAAFDLFSDQVAFFVSQIGTATIYDRSSHHA